MIHTNDRAIMLRYHEVALKGDNRGWFEDRLVVNTRRMLVRELTTPDGTKPQLEISREHSRIVIYYPWSDTAHAALSRVFGVTGIGPIRIVPTEKEAILKACIEEFEGVVAKQGVPRTFRVQTRRSDKVLPEKSMDLDRFFGSHLKDLHPEMLVDLSQPDFTLGIEIRSQHSFIWVERHPGPGGLPVETNGRVLSLISGGLDSPVASIRALRRGCAVEFIHFYGTPFVGEESLHKVEDLVRLVNRYQPDARPLHVVPFGKLQEKIALATPAKVRTILYRRMMMRIASRLGESLEAHALITGEAIGQVASQTLENIETINSVATLPVLRPLCGYDKDEIIAEAKRWGTYETAIRPAADCCTLFSDRHPSIRSTPTLLQNLESDLPIEEWVAEAINKIEVRRIPF